MQTVLKKARSRRCDQLFLHILLSLIIHLGGYYMIKAITKVLPILSIMVTQFAFGQQADQMDMQSSEPLSAHEKMDKIVIVRHGQSDHNLFKIVNSDPKHPDYFVSNLTDYGKEEVKTTGQILRDSADLKNIVAIYASPLPRTQQTATIIANELGLNLDIIETDDRVSEVKAGDYESNCAYHYQQIKNSSDIDIESEQDLQNRVYDFYMDINMKHPEGDIIVVTHAHPAALLMEYAAYDADIEFPSEYQDSVGYLVDLDQHTCHDEACKTQLYIGKSGELRPRTSGFRVYPRTEM